ncbi:hypoxanthine phosphoribosyltransferase [uncultured bacterium]|uniref:Hypoxanthine phosphoribosyltransferase n=2 Tax=Acetilactobacillus jinshanensis TaxID=1720083 RepID=A0A4P6ZMA9_9LACO|nr:hypoxanthine phosphoribosyltransferase [Acetilactobacillus jinshanensis]QBP19021.1 hypoxanthine phosphoribosyltransferase [Acetilactobacillus jinshanensis]URL61923.1 hypoxanthine phosphoribosyltransferase [uncultured bacterium]
MVKKNSNPIQKVLYRPEQLQQRCAQLGRQITRDYQGKHPLVVGVLTGAMVFMTDLIRQIKLPIQIDFVDASSYFNGTQSTGKVKLVKDTTAPVKGRDVLIVEDMIDSGHTLKFLKHHFMELGAKSVQICVLLDKPQRREVSVDTDYVGFKIPNVFIVGYGIDYQQRFRNLPYVAALSPLFYK